MNNIDITQDPFRPDVWDEFIGQAQVKETLKLHCESTLSRSCPLDHIFLAAPPGTGKSSLAFLIAKESADPIVSIHMPVKKIVLIRIVRQHKGILFLDELHRSPRRDQEELLTLLEDGFIHTDHGTVIKNEWLSVIAATTEPQMITPAVLDRFPIRPHFEPYTDDELTKIVEGMARRIDLTLPQDVLDGIALASGGIPRNARSLVTTARDLLVVRGEITMEEVLTIKQLTADGLTRDHVNYLNLLYSQDGRAGLSTLANTLRMHPHAVNDLERLLIQREYIVLTANGRELLPNGYTKVQEQGGS